MGREDVLFSHMEVLTKNVNGTRQHLGVLAREIVDSKIRTNAMARVLAKQQKVLVFLPTNAFQRVVIGTLLSWLGIKEGPVLSEKLFVAQMDAEDKAAKDVAEKAVVAQMQQKLEADKKKIQVVGGK